MEKKKKIILIILSILVTIVGIISFKLISEYFSIEHKLKNAGYSDETIIMVKDTFNEKEIEYLIYYYSNNLNKLITNKKFIYKNYNKYLEYIKYLKSVNKLLDDRIIEVINDKDYIKDNLLKYINWYEIDTNIEYNNKYIKIINDSDYKEENILKYYDFYKQDINLEYNNKYIKMINDTNYKEENLVKYYNYYKQYSTEDFNSKILELINDLYYKESNLARYKNYYNSNKNLSIRAIVENVNCNIDRPYYTNYIQTDISKGFLMLLNKYNQLPANYVPSDLVSVGYGSLIKTAADAFNRMKQDAAKANMYINVTSPYRSYYSQQSIYNNYVSLYGQKETDTFSARPGFSEHQTGLAIDINASGSIYTEFDKTKEYIWMCDNGYKYGFILRYPKGKEKQTGYSYESWHYRYVGEKVAKEIKEKGITFDEYYEYYLK